MGFIHADDPEGSFVPPEFDSTGSTFEVRGAIGLVDFNMDKCY